MRKTVQLAAALPAVCRLGLATRGNTHLRREDVEYAIGRGVNYLNWCGKSDGMSRAIAGLGTRRRDVVVAVQFQARNAEEAEREFDRLLDELKTDYLDVVTLYYVEAEHEWRAITGSNGAWSLLAKRKEAGTLKMIGLTSHQRELATSWARQVVPPGERSSSPSATPEVGGSVKEELVAATHRHLDMLMIRYNAAHRGAEREVFPVTRELRLPVVTFTGLRWKALLQATPDDPRGFSPPSAADCYRFCLSNPDVSVALSAPGNRAQLDENLALLEDWRSLDTVSLETIRNHGDRVRRHAGEFW